MKEQIIEKDGKKYKVIEIIENESDWLYIPELKIEVELNVHDKDKSWNDLNLSEKEDQLLTIEQCIFLANSKYAKKLKMDGSSSQDDFYIKQPFDLNRKNRCIAGFVASSDWAGLGCYWDPTDANSSLGVRFCGKISKTKKRTLKVAK